MSSISNNLCAYVNCTNNKLGRKDISFFKFPIKNVERAKQWQKHCGNIEVALMDISALENKKVCEEHFLPSDFKINNKRKLLMANAVPIKYNDIGKLIFSYKLFILI